MLPRCTPVAGRRMSAGRYDCSVSTPSLPIPFHEAFALVRAAADCAAGAARESEAVALLDSRGRVLALPLLADRNQPPFPRATRDGFAARAADWALGSLAVTGLLRAGEAWTGGAISQATCIEIMTGAPVPEGADSVVMVEHAERGGASVTLQLGRTISNGENVVPAGAEAREGTVLVPAGTRMTAHGIAVAASCGHDRVAVVRRPRVAILATGDELVEVDQVPLPHQIRNSNSVTLAALVRGMGGEPVLSPPVADAEAALESAIGEAAEQCDLLLLSGGVSMGRYDLVEPVLAGLGGTFHFTGALIQPGKPVVFGSLGGSLGKGSLGVGGLPFFGLPGNPVSTIVCFALFVAPLLAALGGEPAYTPPFAMARLAEGVRTKPGLTRFLPARLSYALEGATVEPIPWQGSGDLASTAQANCFLVVPPDAPELRAGDVVSVLLA